jgi:hypothetical protein
MFVAFSYLSVPFKIPELPTTSMHYAIESEQRQTAESRSTVCLAFPVVVKSFEVARCHRPPVSVCYSEEIKMATLQGMYEDRVTFE